jgi:hypothetical protein
MMRITTEGNRSQSSVFLKLPFRRQLAQHTTFSGGSNITDGQWYFTLQYMQGDGPATAS